MGSKNSKPIIERNETVYDILEISESATKEEIKKQYVKLLFKYHPDRSKSGSNERTSQIMKAYAELEKVNFKQIFTQSYVHVDLKGYNQKNLSKLAEEDFFVEINSIVERIIKNELLFEPQLKIPKFGDSNSNDFHKFYAYFETFKTYIKFDNEYKGFDEKYIRKKYDQSEKRKYNNEIRDCIKFIKILDPRIRRSFTHKKNLNESSSLKKPPKKIYKKDATQYLIYCDACLRGFMSQNSANNHMNTNKHKANIKEKGLEEIDVENLIKEFEDINLENKQEINEDSIYERTIYESVTVEEINEQQEDKSVEAVEKHEEASTFIEKTQKTKKNKKTIKVNKKKYEENHKEYDLLLICSHCKERFQSRNKLFDHIRTNHTKKSI